MLNVRGVASREAYRMQWGRGAFLENSLFAQDVDNTVEISHGVTCLMACCVGSSSKCHFILHLPYYTGEVAFTCSKSA